MATSLLLAEQLHVSLHAKPILKDLSFHVERGHWIGLVGPNGSGKTTLLRAIAGLIPYAGTLNFQDKPIRAWSAKSLAQHMALVRQTSIATFAFTVEEVVLLGRHPHKGWLDPVISSDKSLAHKALVQVNLEGFAHRSITSLSGGECRRVFLAQALVQQPVLLLLDEPTAHLDVYHQFEWLDHVAEQVQAGQTVIAVFHDLEQAARYAQTLWVLQEGRLIATGTPATVLTPDLIASVFRMKAQVIHEVNHPLRITYHNPV